MQRTRVRALVLEDLTCRVRGSWARAPQLLSLRSRARGPRLLKPVRLELVLRNERPPQWEARAPQ